MGALGEGPDRCRGPVDRSRTGRQSGARAGDIESRILRALLTGASGTPARRPPARVPTEGSGPEDGGGRSSAHWTGPEAGASVGTPGRRRTTWPASQPAMTHRQRGWTQARQREVDPWESIGSRIGRSGARGPDRHPLGHGGHGFARSEPWSVTSPPHIRTARPPAARWTTLSLLDPGPGGASSLARTGWSAVLSNSSLHDPSPAPHRLPNGDLASVPVIRKSAAAPPHAGPRASPLPTAPARGRL